MAKTPMKSAKEQKIAVPFSSIPKTTQEINMLGTESSSNGNGKLTDDYTEVQLKVLRECVNAKLTWNDAAVIMQDVRPGASPSDLYRKAISMKLIALPHRSAFGRKLDKLIVRLARDDFNNNAIADDEEVQTLRPGMTGRQIGKRLTRLHWYRRQYTNSGTKHPKNRVVGTGKYKKRGENGGVAVVGRIRVLWGDAEGEECHRLYAQGNMMAEIAEKLNVNFGNNRTVGSVADFLAKDRDLRKKLRKKLGEQRYIQIKSCPEHQQPTPSVSTAAKYKVMPDGSIVTDSVEAALELSQRIKSPSKVGRGR